MVDWIRPLLSRDAKVENCFPKGDFDKTGILVDDARTLEILFNDGEIIFSKYQSIAHSFWRSQELSLINRYRNFLQAPVMDFGCGDGSFASVIFDRIDFGVDVDPDALRLAKKYGIYSTLLLSTNTSIPVNSSSLRSIFSNSVLEHLYDLDSILAEINRILIMGGVFIFSVPTIQFYQDLVKYFGEREANRINKEYVHRNIFSQSEWQDLLISHGFSMLEVRQYQPDWFTFAYRMFRLLGKRGLGYFLPDLYLNIWALCKTNIVAMIRNSINYTSRGGNIFVVAVKSPEQKTKVLQE